MIYKIQIDNTALTDGNSFRGIGYYTRNLLAAIQQELKYNPDFKDFSLVNQEPDLVHIPSFNIFKPINPYYSKPYILTVHDLIPIEYKKHFPVGIRGNLYWFLEKIFLRRATFIICPSHHVKYSINRLTGYPLNRIYTISEAADHSFKRISDTKALNFVKNKYKLPSKFIFYVGDVNWNKNVPGLVKACQSLKYHLVIAGKSAVQKVPLHPWTKDIHWLQRQKSPYLHLLGFVSDEDLPYIFNLATIYCQPSFAEGFGLPLLQAMQSGTPTCFSNTTSLPEISNFSGLSFNPKSPTDLKSKLKILWTNSELRKKYSLLGKKRSQIFSWQKAAIETLTLYRLYFINEQK